MSITATREALIGGDLDTWGAYEQAHNHLSIGLNTTRLYMSGATLYQSKGKFGLYDGTQWWVVHNDAARSLSVAALTASRWARVELSVVAGTVTTELTSISTESDPYTLPDMSSYYDEEKGGYYYASTKRLLALLWITGAGACAGVVNFASDSRDYSGYAVRSNFARAGGQRRWRVNATTGSGSDLTYALPALTGLGDRYRLTKEDAGTKYAILDGNSTEKIGVEGNAETFTLYAQGDWVEVEDCGTYWDVVGTNGPVLEYSSTSSAAIGSPQSGTWYNPASHSLVCAPGKWDLEYFVQVLMYDTGVAWVNSFATLSTANNSESDPSMSQSHYITASGAIYLVTGFARRRPSVVCAVQTTYYLLVKGATDLGGALTNLATAGATQTTKIRARRVG